MARGAIHVGAAAKHDPVLAEASRLAAETLVAMARAPVRMRVATMTHRLDAIAGSGAGADAFSRIPGLMAQGKSASQAEFDAMRLTIANRLMERGLRAIRDRIQAIKVQQGADVYDAGLGDIAPNDRAAGCAAASVGGTVGGALQVIPVVGTIVGAVLGIAGGIAGSALDCGREQREAAQRLAATQAAAAQAAIAQAQALEAARQAQSAGRNLILLVGAGALLAGGVAYWVLK